MEYIYIYMCSVRLYLKVLAFSFLLLVPTSISPCNDCPPGLIILEDFISKEEEDLLVSSIQWKCDSCKCYSPLLLLP